MPDETIRIAVYTHDTFGLGHMRRCLNIIEELARSRPDAAVLLITGSPAVGKLGRLPGNVDVVKLPTIAPTGETVDKPSHLPLPTRDLIDLRRDLIGAVLERFAPDVFLVDNFALGARKELGPVLEKLAARSTRTILGLRDIVDAPDVIRARWPRDGVIDALEHLYDDILVFGEKEVFDPVTEYALPETIAAKLTFCGYTARSSAPASDAELATLGLGDDFILVTVGGGGDGLPLIRSFLAGRDGMRDLPALVVAGPLAGAASKAEIEKLTDEATGVVLVDFLPDLPAYMKRAALVLCMGGYNTVCELMRNDCRALIIPRDWRFGQHAQGTSAGVEMEQILRAEKLSAAGRAHMLSPADLGPERLAAAIDDALSEPRRAGAAMTQDGAVVAAGCILDRIDAKRRRPLAESA